jgi:prolyl 4-hydroxylase
MNLNDGMFTVFAFIAPTSIRSRRPSSVILAKRTKPRKGSSGAGFGKKEADPKKAIQKEDGSLKDRVFNTHFSDFVTKEDIGNLLSVCTDAQNSDWANSCKIEIQPGSRTVITTKDVSKGQILTLLPIHALGLRNIRDERDGVEYIEFISDQDEAIYNTKKSAVIRLNVPLDDDEVVHSITGEKTFIRMFVLSLPTKESVPGWLGNVIKFTSDADNTNCVTLPIPFAAPFCAVVATTDVKAGNELLHRKQPLEWSEIEELYDIISEDQDQHDSISKLLRLQIQNVILGPFHQINLKYPGLTQVHSDPDVFEVEGFLTDDECDRVIAEARPQLKPVEVYNEESDTYEQSQRRTNTFVEFWRSIDSSIVRKLENLALIKAGSIEGATVLNYQVGQEVKPHTDHAHSNIEGLKQFRIGVAFCYLNNVSEGGSTYFNELGLDLKPRKGTAVIHFPSDLKGRTDERTLHQGSPAIDEKWLLVMAWFNVPNVM